MTKEPPDRSVYFRRRLVVLLGLVAIIVAVVLVVLKPGAGSATRDAAQVEVPGDLAHSSETDATPNCSSTQLDVTPIVSQDTYKEGDVPLLSLSVENTGSEDCVADLGTAHMQFVLTSGSDEVWRSADCQKKAEVRPVILEPGKPLETEEIEWDRTRSDPETCDEVRDEVSLGGSTYHLSVTVAGVSSNGTASFLLY